MGAVLFVVPPFSYGAYKNVGPKAPPLGPATIAAYLEKAGYEVKILDAFALDLSQEKILEEIKKMRPVIVFSGGPTACHPATLAIFNGVKKFDNSIITVYGGPHITNLYESAMTDNAVDYGILGEGEITALEICDKVFGKNDLSPSQIKGIAYRDGEGKVQVTEPRPFIMDLNTVPMPAYHLLPMDAYKSYGWLDLGRRFTTMITSRGCPFKCSFCNSSKNFKHWWRSRSAETVYNEIKYLYDNFDIRHIYFQDDEFCVWHDRVKKICEMIKADNLDLVWECLTRVNHIDEDLIKTMAWGGCKSILYGVEVGYEEGYKKINKPVNLDMVLKAFKLTQKYKIMAKASFIIGFPWESEKEIRKTINFAKKLDADITFFNILTPYPGTYIMDELQADNLFVNGGDWGQHASHGSEPIIRTKYLTAEQLSYWNGRAYLELYMRPKYMLRKLAQIRNMRDLQRNLLSGKDLIVLAARRMFTKPKNLGQKKPTLV